MSRSIVAAMCWLFAVVCHGALAAPANKTLSAFASEAELRKVLQRYVQAERQRPQPSISASVVSDSVLKAEAPPAPESVTNTQTAGVDEGGIVKVHGKHLVILRRGRLFTVNIDQKQLEPVAALDAYGPDVDPAGSWYDELLISGNTVVVIGFSYSRGGTEIGLFDIDEGGQLAYRATYHMRSNDYYSSRNYASRLVGSKLIFYAPLELNPRADDLFASFPAMRKWRPHGTPADFRPIAPATRIYRSGEELDYGSGLALHSVTICDLARREMECEANAVLGPRGRVFHVSARAVYVWTNPVANRRALFGDVRPQPAALFRLPLDGQAPSALKVTGAPIDQFSFLEGADGKLNVLVRAASGGEGMWGSEASAGPLALLRVPLDQFGDGRASAPARNYQPLPAAGGTTVQNRYVGQFLLYGAGTSWGSPKDGARQALHAVRLDNAGSAQSISLPHGVERIEPLGQHALVIGAAGPNLHFTTFNLGEEATLAQRYVRAGAAQAETRSHGFFYKASDAGEGTIGLPVVQASGGQIGASAAVLFLRNSGLQLTELGSLSARAVGQRDDGCRASCVDWYGNARPLFVRGRVFALMGYEVVEGQLRDARIVATRRASFAPALPFPSTR